ncbi:MAG: lysophospholipid acyltransferase family protein [Verrucomicrobiaceae bacterium]|nr:lysophospholipid acyltransferase family protein [Verrucomicrobiaceae bacterium]
MARIRIKNLGKLVAWLMRGIAATLKFEVEDRAALFDASRKGCIWAFWHNRMFLIPYVHDQWFSHVPGTILTSPSGDGQIIADVCASFGIEAERGSSSRPEKGMSALIALAAKAREGFEIGITPDGPRGPLHRVQPGIVKLAQLTGVPIIPVHVNYSRAYRFSTWDEFLLPLPFAKASFIFDKPVHVPRRMTEEEFELYRAKLEETLRAGVQD